MILLKTKGKYSGKYFRCLTSYKMKILEVFESFDPKNDFLTTPYVIAEAGVNHEGSMETAKRLIQEAQEGGAHAIKFQTYKADTLASKDSPAYWDTSKEPTKSQHELFQRHDKFWKTEYEELKRVCDTEGIEFMSTPFDVASAHFLNDMMDVFKISSSDITNKPFIEFLCDFKKPIILSTGASYLTEVKDAVSWIEKKEVPLSLLHCMLNYPTENKNAFLGFIQVLKQEFPDKMIGYSDHTLPEDMRVLLNATLLGSRILEKHFTHDKTLPGNDHYHAMDVHDLKFFFERLDDTMELMGGFELGERLQELPSRKNARRSLVANCDIPAGKVIDADDLTWKRPAHGISPREIDDVIGKKAINEIPEDTVLKWDLIDQNV